MIYVTQGHEKGIGLEIFLKSYLMLSIPERENITLIVNQNELDRELQRLKLTHIKKKLKTIFPNQLYKTQTLNALIHALTLIKKNDILFTLPTSKDQLTFNNKKFLGYTEFLRYYFKNKNLAMFFYSDEIKILLLTDHIPHKNISKTLTQEFITSKIKLSLKSLKAHRIFNPEKIYMSGLNPHAGENQLLGKEEIHFIKAITQLKIKNLEGPLPGDTFHLKQNSSNNLLIYSSHEQGLPFFKSNAKFLGANITLGLPFIRLSVDHGTAFEIYGKNKANYLGCLYCLKKSLGLHQ